MFDAPCFSRPWQIDRTGLAEALSLPIAVGRTDSQRFLGAGETSHMNRIRPCGWHLVVHRTSDAACWTHLYKVVPDHGGRVLALLWEAVEGNCGDAPERFSRWPLPEGRQGCKAG